jgi:dolichyl-diphosphooligosaccharide--protein glycosyltransferase
VSEQGPGKKRDFLPILIVGAIMAALFGISLYIRIALPHDQIFVNGAVWFRETDSYYYMRNIEVLVHNFPHYNSFDPYMLFPGGSGALSRPFFAWLVAGIVLLTKGATASLQSMQTVAAHMPAILGSLTIIPVYFIGKELFNRWAGVISAALLVVLPGEFLHRSLLGFTDHHVAETLFSTVAILFLIMAIKRAREREISFQHVLSKNWPIIRRPLIYVLLAGIFLGLYLLTWQGGLMFIFIVFIYLVIQFIVDHLRRKSTDYLCIVGTPLFFVALLMLLPLLARGSFDMMTRVSLLIAILAPVVLSALSRFMAARSLKPVYYVFVVLGLTGIGAAVLQVVNPSLLGSMFSQFGIFTPTGSRLTIMEVTGLLAPQGTFTLSMAWANFTTSFFISFIALVMLAFALVKERSAHKSLFVVWSVVMLLAVLGQRRFGYYYAVNAALLTGYFSWKMLDLAGLGKLLAKPREVVEEVRKFKKKKHKDRERAKPRTFMQPRGTWITVLIVGIVLFFLVVFPNVGLWRDSPTDLGGGLYIGYTKSLARQAPIMDRGWYNSTSWLKDNTPEPFGDPDFYYELYPPSSEFEYPDAAYGVMSWWDYGYFIMQIGHRIPNANPGQKGAVQAGKFFTSQNETSANLLADELGTKYVMIDQAMATGKFYAMVDWAGKNLSEFYEYYYLPTQGGGLSPFVFYNPAYYYSTVTRLYCFDGKGQLGSNTLVVMYREEVSAEIRYKLVSGIKLFSSYADAEGYVSGQEITDYSIVGFHPLHYVVVGYEETVSEEGVHYRDLTDIRLFSSRGGAQDFLSSQQTGNYELLEPLVSPVPLEALADYERVYPDPADTTTSTAVKIFEYLGGSDGS